MAPKAKVSARCQVCTEQPHKYTCPQCRIVYCSLACYKTHKESACAPAPTIVEPVPALEPEVQVEEKNEEKLSDPIPLRPLTSLNWPYVPDESAYPDPLKRDDPKTLKTSQYEAIATSLDIRTILSEHKNLPGLLTNLDKLRGPDREQAFQKALGLTAPDIERPDQAELSEDVIALRRLAEAVETAVRGGDKSALGVDWC